MINNQFIMPANSKKSRLIFGLFTVTDLIVLGVGILLTVFMLFILKEPKLWETIISAMPLILSVCLVFPVANYHNVLQLVINIVNYLTGRKKYYWKGWCVKDDTNE